MNSIESAYEKIATTCLSIARLDDWDEVILEAKIFSKMAKIVSWLKFENSKFQAKEKLDAVHGWDLLDVIILIRDDLIKTTGKRIWGLTFKLFPDGKFEIEYDYNKPEDYEETDELISFEEINESLNNLKG